MLYKHSSALAREATFERPRPGDIPKEEGKPSAPSPEERELARLRCENAELKAQMAELQSDWTDALSDAQQRAREEAALAHVRDDRQVAMLLAKSLDQANADFTDQLLAEVGPAASAVAECAFTQLVRLRETDHDWLARLIERRLTQIAVDSVAAVRIGPLASRGAGHDGDVEAALRAVLPTGVTLLVDPKLASGAAQIDLRLGSITIETSEGLARIRAAFASETADG